MTKLALSNKISGWASWLAAIMLVLAPFWAFISVWLASAIGHYTAIRLVLELLLALLALAAASLLALDKKLARKLVKQKWFWLVLAFAALEIIWGLAAYASGNVSLKALGYAWIVDSRYLLFFVAVYLLASKSNFLAGNWKKLLFIPAVIVAIFAILQFAVLPLGFLSHFGYGPHTIFPYETINSNKNFPRAMSFTRGANPLGAYLLVVATLAAATLAARLAKSTRRLHFCARSDLAQIGVLVLGLAALAFSFSRSAWLGTAVSLVLLALLAITSARARKLAAASIVLVAVALALAFTSVSGNTTVQNYLFHTQTNSIVKANSDAKHLQALTNGFSDFASEPLGRGPGTSGPASVHNDNAGTRHAENYYLMIGEEDGWLGLALLLAVFVLVAIELARRKTKLALALFASFIGLAVTNLFLPAWTDVTLAYIFWGLAGLALAKNSSLKADNF
jgi:hypothetical protein